MVCDADKPNSVALQVKGGDHLSGSTVASTLLRHSLQKQSTALHAGRNFAVSLPPLGGHTPKGALASRHRRHCSHPYRAPFQAACVFSLKNYYALSLERELDNLKRCSAMGVTHYPAAYTNAQARVRTFLPKVLCTLKRSPSITSVIIQRLYYCRKRTVLPVKVALAPGVIPSRSTNPARTSST